MTRHYTYKDIILISTGMKFPNILFIEYFIHVLSYFKISSFTVYSTIFKVLYNMGSCAFVSAVLLCVVLFTMNFYSLAAF